MGTSNHSSRVLANMEKNTIVNLIQATVSTRAFTFIPES
jgi:hypothetical protein